MHCALQDDIYWYYEDCPLQHKYHEAVNGFGPFGPLAKDIHVMTMINIMCRNIRMDCAYAANYYETYQIEKDECLEHCLDQHWDYGIDDWHSPCESRPNLESGIWDDDNWVTENLFSDEVR